MKVINAVNVNDALMRGIDLFKSEINYRTQESRNGPTMECRTPVTTVLTVIVGVDVSITIN